MSERVRRLLPNVVYMLLYASGIYGLVLWPPIETVMTAIAEPLRRVLAGHIDSVPMLVRCVIAFVAVDALAYWIHRAAHANALLWRFHRTHHDGPELGVLTTFRFNVVEIAWRMALQFLPLHLLGIAADIPAGAILALLAFNVLAHSDRDWHFGVIGHAFVSPAYHGTHHREERANYGMYLVVWDRLFGTRR
ncbi:MAG TPA: sterol desaturase family protein [Thermoanaerobaculia bacterium]|nr:sterol desaturase family protein [Thermoanaerobaculia bacterium]